MARITSRREKPRRAGPHSDRGDSSPFFERQPRRGAIGQPGATPRVGVASCSGSPERARYRVFRPFRANRREPPADPGRCPGLSYLGLSGRTRRSTTLLPPLRGCAILVTTRFPGLTPWAIDCRPFGTEQRGRAAATARRRHLFFLFPSTSLGTPLLEAPASLALLSKRSFGEVRSEAGASERGAQIAALQDVLISVPPAMRTVRRR
jgi:hypothetical protein